MRGKICQNKSRNLLASYISSYTYIYLLIYMCLKKYIAVYMICVRVGPRYHRAHHQQRHKHQPVASSTLLSSVVGRFSARGAWARVRWRHRVYDGTIYARALLHSTSAAMNSVLERHQDSTVLYYWAHRFFSAVFPYHIKVCFDFWSYKWLEVSIDFLRENTGVRR